MEAAKKRSDWIDYAKGVGIILALIGHAFRDQMFQVYPLFEFAKDMIYSFHMPMFFVLSGIAYAFFSENKQHSIGGFTGGKSKKILVPTLIYAALIYLVFFAAWQAGPLRQVLSRGGYEMVSPLKYLYLLFLEESPYCNHVWFALILFACQVIVFIIEDIYRKITGNKVFSARALFILEAVCLVLYYLIPLKFRMVMYLKFEIMYYIFGIIIVRLGMLNLRHEYSGLAVGVILCAVLKMTNYVTFPGAAIEVIEFIGYFIGAPLLILSIVLLCYKQNEERTAKQI
ncbi:MAG: acyltransferase family protein, partial [Eubacteriales bacterium]|nr:acyltransferase family protein [Eubacteriales bacterium]